MPLIRLIAKVFVFVLGSVVVVCAVTQNRQWWWIGALIGLVASVDEVSAYVRQLRRGSNNPPAAPTPDDGAEADGQAGAGSGSGGGRPKNKPSADPTGGQAKAMSLPRLVRELAYLVFVFVILACAITQRTGWWWIGALIGLFAGADDIATYVRERRARQ
ncbi:MAG: hypothetical protein Q3979_04825 [Actinomycetaceae bacterium]|nr:hypothetical protein [Actinomycetaceae bacterium]